MKKCYLVNYSHGEYDDRRDNYLFTVFLSFSSAEKAKEEFEIEQRTEAPFPSDRFTAEEWNHNFDEIYELMSQEEYSIMNQWEDSENHRKSFNKAWITELILEDE